RRSGAFRRAGRGQAQHRRRRVADHRRLPRLRLYAGERRDQRRAPQARGRHHHRQDQSRPVRHRIGGRAHALRHRAQPVRSSADPGRIEHGLGDRGRRRPRSARARHRHRGIGPRAGGLEQHRGLEAEPRAVPSGVRLGVPMPGQRLFFGDEASAAAYDAALARLARLGAAIVAFDMEPFYETARLLYEGPWVAERYLATRALIASAPQSMHPVTRQIILGGAKPSAADAFAAFYQLEELRRVRDHAFRSIDAMALPTVPTVYTVEQVLADPIALNSRLGTYTN